MSKIDITYDDQDPNSSGSFNILVEFPDMALSPSDQDIADLASWIEANWTFSAVGQSVRLILISQPQRTITHNP